MELTWLHDMSGAEKGENLNIHFSAILLPIFQRVPSFSLYAYSAHACSRIGAPRGPVRLTGLTAVEFKKVPHEEITWCLLNSCTGTGNSHAYICIK
jgi:hypothetical protein